VVQGLASQPSLSPRAQVALRTAQDALQQQMNYAALASDQPGDLRRSGLIAAGSGFEINLRTAEAYRKGADDLARDTGASGEPAGAAEAARRLRALSPDHVDQLLDGAIAIAGMRHLDTAGVMSEGARDNALKSLGAGYLRAGTDIDRKLKSRESFWDAFRPWNKDAVQRRVAPLYAQGLLQTIDKAAVKGLSEPDYASLKWGGYAENGLQNWGNMLGDLALVGAGSVIARAAQQLGARQIEEILAREGADALATRLEAESLSPRGTLGAARAWSIKARLNAVNLPTSGKIRFVPERGYDPNVPLRRGPNHGFVDRFGSGSEARRGHKVKRSNGMSNSVDWPGPGWDGPHATGRMWMCHWTAELPIDRGSTYEARLL
jgi:Novel toxin 17